MSTLPDLRAQWTTLYTRTLPHLAKAKDPAQPKWPVHLDHCFARIILDNAIGVTKPWPQVIKSPAVKNMTTGQFCKAIELGEKICKGQVDLVGLDERSLGVRGKTKRGVKRKVDSGDKEVAEEVEVAGETERTSKALKKTEEKNGETISKYFLPSPKKARTETTSTPSPTNPTSVIEQEEEEEEEEQISPSALPTTPQNKNQASTSPPDSDPLYLISSSNLTPFRKLVLTLLCAVPPGNWTTYAAISAHITKSSHKTCARAVGNAMRNNPFAPIVPCHRVLAAGGAIGGFGGGWGEEGEFVNEKRELLRREGVRFDGKGRAVGRAWCAWEEE